MSVTFFGTKNLPAKNAVCMSWSIDADIADPAVALLDSCPYLPAAPQGPWIVYSLNPVNNQGAFTFGNADALQFQVSSLCPFVYDAAHTYIPGRVLLHVPGTGQVYCIGAGDTINLVPTLGNNNTGSAIPRTVNGVVPVSIPNGSSLEVWFEYDNQYDGGNSYVPPTAGINVTLFNVPISPVGVSQ